MGVRRRVFGGSTPPHTAQPFRLAADLTFVGLAGIMVGSLLAGGRRQIGETNVGHLQ